MVRVGLAGRSLLGYAWVEVVKLFDMEALLASVGLWDGRVAMALVSG